MIGHKRPTMHPHAVVVGPRGSPKEQGNTPRTHTVQPRGSPPAVHLHARSPVVRRPSLRDGSSTSLRTQERQRVHAPRAFAPEEQILHPVRKRVSSARALVAVSLAFFMAVQPVYIAIATELEENAPPETKDVSDDTVVSEPKSVSTDPKPAPKETSVPSPVSADQDEGPIEDNEVQETDEQAAQEPLEEAVADVPVDTTDEETEAPASEIASEDDEDESALAPQETATSSDELDEDFETVVPDVLGTTTENGVPSVDDTSAASSTESEVVEEQLETDEQEPLAEPAPEPATELEAVEEKVQIGDHECTELGDGALYCVERSAVATGDASFTLSRAEARPGPDGNKEIFFFEHGRAVRITHNTQDDFAPMYDATTDRIVWNALIDDRLQLMLHDRRTGQTKQLTDTEYNNSNPQLFGDLLVWQAWIDGNWEIMLSREVTRSPLPVTRLTHNSAPDMFPKIFDETIAWQTSVQGVRHVAVYDTKRHQISYVEKRGDGAYENPRFALLFDERQDDGEVAVLGFDMETRRAIPLTPLSRNTSPEPVTPQDETGEALPSSAGTSTTIKTGARENGENDDDWTLPEEGEGNDTEA